MPITEAQFDRSLLWPPAKRDMPAGAIEGAAGYGGPGLDLGALRTGKDGFVEILVVRLPTAADPRNGEWVQFDPNNPEHVRTARMFSAFGPGHSYGSQTHDDLVAWYETVNGPQAPGWADSLERWTLEHDFAKKDALAAAAKAKQGQAGGTPTAPTPGAPTVPVVPPPAVEPSPALIAVQTIKNLCETEQASLPTKGGGAPINALRKQYREFLSRLIVQAKLGGAT